MIERTSKSRIIFCIFNYGVLIVFGFLCLMPLWHVLMASVSDPRLLMASSGILFAPLGRPTLEGYRIVLSNSAIIEGYGNTLLYVVTNAAAGTFLTAIAGFLVSRKNFKLARPLTVFIMFTMIFSGGLIPTYMVIRSLGFINTRWAIIVPALMNAYYIIVMKSAFEQLPGAYEESAKLDGAGEWHIFWNICLPQCRSALYSIAILVFIDYWNMVEQPLILLPDASQQPLSVYLSQINAGEIGIAFAAAVIYMIPGLLLFLHGEAYLVEGIAHSGSVKG